jgi:hypothetical protein
MEPVTLVAAVTNLGFAVGIAIYLVQRQDKLFNRIMDDFSSKFERQASELTKQTVILALLYSRAQMTLPDMLSPEVPKDSPTEKHEGGTVTQ